MKTALSLKKEFNAKVKSKFKDLTFLADSHEYFVGDKKVPLSVSGKIKQYVEVKDWVAIATKKALREGKTAEHFLQLWKKAGDDACEAGTDTHQFGEDYQDDRSLTADREKKIAVTRFWSDLEWNNPGRYIPVGKEVQMYHLLYFFSGTCDFVLYDTWTGKYIIGDYKTNKDLYKNFREETLLAPFTHLLNCPYNHYQLQLSYYQILLEQIEGFEVEERWLVWLKEDTNYETYSTFDYKDILLEEETIKAA